MPALDVALAGTLGNVLAVGIWVPEPDGADVEGVVPPTLGGGATLLGTTGPGVDDPGTEESPPTVSLPIVSLADGADMIPSSRFVPPSSEHAARNSETQRQ
jgi:hypothetical protein